METENNETPPQSSTVPHLMGEKVIQPLDPTLKAEPPQPVSAAPIGPTPAPVAPPQLTLASAEPSAETQYQPAASSLGFSQSDAIAEENKRARKHKLFIGGVIFAGLIVVAIAAAIIAPSFFGMKTITYNNGRSASFQLKFYSRYTVKAAPGASNGFQELASKVSHQGLYPLVISITKGTPQKPSSALLDCSGGDTTPALQVTNKPTNTTVNLCSEGQDQSAKPIVYLGVLHSGINYYAILINQDVDFPQLISNPQKAHDSLKKIDLSAYNDDITTIVSSIKPLP